MSADRAFFLSVRALADAYATHRLSPVEVTTAVLRRIERLNPSLNAFAQVTSERALVEARAAEQEIMRGRARGLLHGVPVAAKDLFQVRGTVTTAGSLIYGGRRADTDATAVARLEQVGAVLVGTTHLHELALGVTGVNPHFGPSRNPWDLDRMSGGSSGGSAVAVAAGLCFAALGTDTGGSIRIPASFCGVSGLKPTYGRVSRRGVIPLSPQLDHVGVLARGVDDVALATGAIQGRDPLDRSTARLPSPSWSGRLGRTTCGWRIGVVGGTFVSRLDPDVQSAVDAAARVLATAGLRVEETEIPDAVEAGELAHLLILADAAALYGHVLRTRPQLLGEDVRRLIEEGHFVGAADYINAQRYRGVFQRTLDRLFGQYRALVLPATPTPAPRLGADGVQIGGLWEDVGQASTRLVRQFNYAGAPVLTVPCGSSSEGLPIGLQIVTRPGDEFAALSIGHLYERLSPWRTPRQGL